MTTNHLPPQSQLFHETHRKEAPNSKPTENCSVKISTMNSDEIASKTPSPGESSECAADAAAADGRMNVSSGSSGTDQEEKREGSPAAEAISEKSDSSDDKVAPPLRSSTAVVSVELSNSATGPSTGEADQQVRTDPSFQQQQEPQRQDAQTASPASATIAAASDNSASPKAASRDEVSNKVQAEQPQGNEAQPHSRTKARKTPSRDLGGVKASNAVTRTMGSSLFPKPCFTHTPTLEELQSYSFSDFVQDVVLAKAMPKFEDSGDEDDGHEFEEVDWCKTAMPLTQGIAKVTLPNGFWQEEGIGKDRTGRGPAWQKGQPLGDLQIESPITQHIRGMAGVYEYTFTDNDPISIADFRDLADKYRKGQVGQPFDEPPTPSEEGGDEPTNDDDRMIQLDRHFWKRLGPTMPAAWYGADQEGTLFGNDAASGWSLGELDSCLHVLSRVPGVTTPYLYAGMWASVFCAHTEDMNLLSINYLHAGAPKIWYAIAPGADAKRFEALCEFQYSTAARECKEFMRHKRYLLSPMILQKAGIKYTTTIQRPGDAVITFPGGYHFGFNAGFNMAEATNFGVPEWIPYGLQARVCNCRPDSVRIDMKRLISLLELFEADRSRRRALSWKEWSRKREQKKHKGKAAPKGLLLQQKRSMTGRSMASASTDASKKSAKPTNDKKRKLSEQERKNEFWIEVVKPAPTKAVLPKAKSPPVIEEEGRGKRKRKKTMRAVLWEAEAKKEPPPPRIVAEEVWHLAKPFGRKGVEVNDRVLCLLPGTVMSAAGAEDLAGDESEDDADEQCFLGHVVEAADNHARIRLAGLPKSDEVWIPLGVNKLFLDGGRWAEDHKQFQIPKRHYWKEMDSKSRAADEDE